MRRSISGPPRLYRRYANRDTPFFLREANRLPPEGVLDRANVELLVLGRARTELVDEARARGHVSIYADETVRIFGRKSSPRYFFTTDYRVLGGNRRAVRSRADARGKDGAGRAGSLVSAGAEPRRRPGGRGRELPAQPLPADPRGAAPRPGLRR